MIVVRTDALGPSHPFPLLGGGLGWPRRKGGLSSLPRLWLPVPTPALQEEANSKEGLGPAAGGLGPLWATFRWSRLSRYKLYGRKTNKMEDSGLTSLSQCTRGLGPSAPCPQPAQASRRASRPSPADAKTPHPDRKSGPWSDPAMRGVTANLNLTDGVPA